MIKVLFLGNGEFGYDVLKTFDDSFSKFEWSWVYTKKDKYIKSKLSSSKITHSLQLFSSESSHETELIIDKIKPSLIITASWGQKLSNIILSTPKFGCYNFHPSLLPKLRGPSPIKSAILFDYKKTGLTIYKMNEQIDAGPICLQKEILIKDNIYYQELYLALLDLVAEKSPYFLQTLLKNMLTYKPQNNNEASYCKKLETKDGFLDFSKSLNFNLKIIRAFHNNIGASILFENDRYLIRQAISFNISNQDKEYGIVNKLKINQIVFLKKRIIARVKDGFLEIQFLQKEGKKQLSAIAFLNGWKNKKILNTFNCFKMNNVGRKENEKH